MTSGLARETAAKAAAKWDCAPIQSNAAARTRGNGETSSAYTRDTMRKLMGCGMSAGGG